MGKKLKKKNVAITKKVEYYKKTDTFGNIEELIFPNSIRVGLSSNTFDSTISGSIHHTRQGDSYLVEGTGIQILSSSNGQVTISTTEAAQGDPGEDGSAITFVLSPQSVVFPADSSGVVSDYSLADTELRVYENGTLLSYNNTLGNSNWKIRNPNATTSNITYTSGNFSVSSNVGSFTGHLSNMTADSATVTYNITVQNKFGNQTNYEILQTLAKSKQGSNGSIGLTGPQGDPGNDGSDGSAITIILDPLSVLLIANSSGTVSDYTPSGAIIKVYENGTAININTSVSSNSTWYVVSATGTNITAGAVSQTNGQSSATVADASGISANTATIAHVVRVKNSLGVTTDYTVTQTLAKSISGADGSDGSDGSSSVAIYGIDASGGNVDISLTSSSTNNYKTPWDATILANTNVVGSNTSGDFRLASTGTYMATVQILAEQDGDANITFELSFAQDDGSASYTDVTSWQSSIEPGGNGKSGEFLISNAIFTYSNAGGGGVYRLKTQIKKSSSNPTHIHVKSSSSYLATIRIEKLS